MTANVLLKHRIPLAALLLLLPTAGGPAAHGQEFPAVHDRRHTLNVVLQTRGPLGSDLSIRWGYGSPLPFTPFIGEWHHRFYYTTNHNFDDYELEPIASPVLALPLC